MYQRTLGLIECRILCQSVGYVIEFDSDQFSRSRCVHPVRSAHTALTHGPPRNLPQMP